MKVLEAISKLKLKNIKNHFSILVVYNTSQPTAIQAYETTFETTCKASCAVTSRLLSRGLSFQPTPSNFTRRHVFKFRLSNKKIFLLNNAYVLQLVLQVVSNVVSYAYIASCRMASIQLE